VECPVIPGCISQGDSRDEALAHIREAIELCLENQAAEGWLLPEQIEITKIAV
jgi:predicted RNase H-like HicB family nuclease